MFKNGARFLGRDGDYSPFPGDYGELFPLICDVVSGSVRGGNIPVPVERICAIKRRTIEQLMQLHAAHGHVHAERMLKIVPHMTQTEVELVCRSEEGMIYILGAKQQYKSDKTLRSCECGYL